MFLEQSLITCYQCLFSFNYDCFSLNISIRKLTKSNNTRYVIVGLISCIVIYYLKDLSIALGKTNRIPLTLATWMPIIIIGLFSSVGILQINEK